MSESSAAAVDVFYPIVPDADWLARLVPLGVRTIQLRIKDATSSQVRAQIAASLKMTRAHACQLIVNDYWREAIAEGADYIHLGQEDLAEADVDAIKAAGLRLLFSLYSMIHTLVVLDLIIVQEVRKVRGHVTMTFLSGYFGSLALMQVNTLRRFENVSFFDVTVEHSNRFKKGTLIL